MAGQAQHAPGDRYPQRPQPFEVPQVGGGPDVGPGPAGHDVTTLTPQMAQHSTFTLT